MLLALGGFRGEALLLHLLLFIAALPRDECFEEWTHSSNSGSVHQQGRSKPHQEAKRVEPRSSRQDCRCHSGEISCGIECLCVPTSKVCDGYPDCPNAADESKCAKPLCLGRFACASGECIIHELTCDGDPDCADGSDESMCQPDDFKKSPYNCSGPNQFNCSDGEFCIPITWRCDGDNDCHDNSDEDNYCFQKGGTCLPTDYQCRNGRCISYVYVCDGQFDCEDNSDEYDCPPQNKIGKKCDKDEFTCETANRCVGKEYVCDGEDDCGDWSDEKECSSSTTCSPHNFRCNSGKCIEGGWKCDGIDDCENGEDEKGCEEVPNCTDDMMWCPSKCISNEWRCDGDIDCPTGEDETDCSPEITCEKDLFTCASGECLLWHKVCNGHQDCANGKDESDCKAVKCKRLRCGHGCYMYNNTERCICPSGYGLDKDNSTCVDINECEAFRPCSQLCENTLGSYRCDCVRGYDLRPDKETCKAKSPPGRLMFATRSDIRQINLLGQEFPPISMNLQNAIAVDYHYRRSLVYWTDVTIDAILMSYHNGTGKKEIVRWGLMQPCGLAVDWYNDHIYWVDSYTRRVEVADLDGSNRRPLVWTDLQKPRSIVVHPERSLIIWTDWGKHAKIEKAYMDGSGREILIGDRLYWPNGLTIDYPTETLYWVDAKKHMIEAAHIDGTRRRKVNLHKIPHPFSISVFEDRLFWTDWKTHSIHSINKRTGRDVSIVTSDLVFPMGIKSYHEQRQPMLSIARQGCAWNNGGCSHLCLPTSHAPACFCPHGLYLLGDRRTCSSEPARLLLFVQRNNLRMISLQEELQDASQSDIISYFPKDIAKDESSSEGARPHMDNVVPVDSVKGAMALDFDHQEDMIYWTDVKAHTISRAHLNGSGQQVLVSTNLEVPGGIALDWLNRKLYWTDDGLNRIEVANLDGSNRALLVWENLDHPRDIVVYQKKGFMFWTEWGANASIVRAGMDGSEPVKIISTKLSWPNGLAIDSEVEYLYWLDAKYHIIELSDLNGNRRKAVIQGNLPHPFGLALYDRHLFWSDWKTRSIYMADKYSGDGRKQLVRGLEHLMDVRVFHRRSIDPSFENPCSSRNGGCSHLCLLNQEGYSCACPTGLSLQVDKKKCKSLPSQWLVFAHRTLIRSLSLDTPYVADVVLNLPNLHNVVTLDIDPVSGHIFLPDIGSEQIFRCSIDGFTCKVIVTSTVSSVEGIAVEASSRKIYWTDYERHSIEVSELDGTNRRVLFTKLDKPRAITTHFPSGKFFWTDWADHRPRIEVADLDGQRRKVFVDEQIAWPNGLTIDWETKELFWTDAKLGHIQAISLDGINRRRVASGRAVGHPYGVAVLEENVYWTDWESKALLKALKKDGSQLTPLREGLPGLMDIKAMPRPALMENHCGKSNGNCSNLCLRNPQGFSCTCPTGLILTGGRRCASLPSKYLIVASRGLIRRISLDTKPLWDVGLDIPGMKHPVALGIHYKKQLLFYTDTDVHAIRVVPLSNTSFPETIPIGSHTSPDGLAVDWVADNIYWTDSVNKIIVLARLDGSSQKIIVDMDLHEPRAIAIFPDKGYLFWTDWGNQSKIERTYLDGSDRIILHDEEIGWPNGLVIDYGYDKIYWTDAQKDTLESSGLDGENRVKLMDGLPHPFGVTLLGKSIFWTDWEKRSVERCNKTSCEESQIIVTDIQDPMEIVAVDSAIQNGWNPCGEENGGCTNLCLFRGNSNIICACPDAHAQDCSTTPLFKIGGYNPSKDKNEGEQHTNQNLVTIVVGVGVAIVTIVAVLVAVLYWMRHRKDSNATEGSIPNGGGLTYTNPTYSTSHSDVTTDRKTFFRRLHQDNQQAQLFDERGEVAALISEGSSVEHDSPPPTPPRRPGGMP